MYIVRMCYLTLSFAVSDGVDEADPQAGVSSECA